MNRSEELIECLEAELEDRDYLIGNLRAELAALREQVPVPHTKTFVQPVPEKCDRIVWRGRYYGLPLTDSVAPVVSIEQQGVEYAAPVAKQVVMPERLSEFADDDSGRKCFVLAFNSALNEVARLNSDHLASHQYDETKERALFEAAMMAIGMRLDWHVDDEGDAVYLDDFLQGAFIGWIKCAKSRAKAAGCE
jgi:hypothetical protein